MGGMGSRSMGSGSEGLGFRLVFPNEHVYDAKVSIRCKLHILQTIIFKLSWKGDRLVNNLSEWDRFPWGEYMWREFHKRVYNVVAKHMEYHLKMLGNNPRYVANYALYEFVFPLKTFSNSIHWWRKDDNAIPCGVAWSNGLKFEKSNYEMMFYSPNILDMQRRLLSLEHITKTQTNVLSEPDHNVDHLDKNGNGSVSVQFASLDHQSTERDNQCMYSKHLDKNHPVDGLDHQSVEGVSQVTSVNKDLAEELETRLMTRVYLRQILFLAVLTWIIWIKMVALLMLKLWLDLSYDKGDSIRLMYPIMSCHRPPLKLNAKKAFNYQKSNIKKIIKTFIGADGNETVLLPWNEDLTRSPNAPKRPVSVPKEIMSLFLDKKKMEMQWTFPWIDDSYRIQMDFWQPNDDWAMASPYLSDMLSRYELPLYYADGSKYGVPWFASGVEKVYFPVNEKDFYWCLAELHIRSGVITFYDSLGGPYNGIEDRLFCLELRKILSFTFQLIWIMLMLSHNLPLEVDDSIEFSLAYRERLIEFFWKHKMSV
nr:hypothetical protein [Tanacetum cinerariifolium]